MKYYCIGIKGSGMSTLAQILYDLGNKVSGYDDAREHKFTEDGLIERNIPVFYDQDHELDKDTIVTYSAAFDINHPEIQRVKKLGLIIKQYHDILGDLSHMFTTISVAGTHGKTTTSTLISHILENTIGCNYFIGDGSGYANKDNSLFVLESCEYQKHFLAYRPTYTVITNIELEHTECFQGIDDIINTFNILVDNTKDVVIMCGDDFNVLKIKTDKKKIYYGINDNNDLIAQNIVLNDKGSQMDVYYNNEFYGNFQIPLYGKHMILNTLAMIAVCDLLGIKKDVIHDLLNNFKNAKRRFNEEIIGNTVIIDDYAHHPTEIKVTFDSVRQKYPNKKIIGVIMPNTYSRTLALKDDFVSVLNTIDYCYVTPINCNRERKEDYLNIDSNIIVNELKNGEVINRNNLDKLLQYEDAVICFLSCANISPWIDDFKNLLKEKL